MTINKTCELLKNSSRPIVLSGAGVSAESGVPTFRDAGGLWRGHDPVSLASPDAFARDPKLVWQFYNERRQKLIEVEPNHGHHALAKAKLPIITQNVDRLHQAAGSEEVIELHGNIWEVRCVSCKYSDYPYKIELSEEPKCPNCQDWLRPCVVWFGEMLPEAAIAKAEQWTGSCDLMLVVGTSGVVYPAAGFVHVAKQHGVPVIEINREETPLTPLIDLHIQGDSGEVLPLIVNNQ